MDKTIPKRIFQTGNSKDLPQFERATTFNVKNLNPDYEYLFFDDDDRNDFMRTEYPEFIDTYNNFRYPIQKYDFLRYLVIYKYGGFYFDMDILLSDNLDELLKYSCVFPFERISNATYVAKNYKIHWDLGNYGFGAAPKHPFIEKLIDNVCRSHKDPHFGDPVLNSLPKFLRTNHESYILCTSGPLMVTRAYAENPDLQDQVEVLLPNNIQDIANWEKFGKYGMHLRIGAWRPQKHYLHRKLFNQLDYLWTHLQIRRSRQ